MTENNDHAWLEQLENLIQNGQPTSDELLNTLAGTNPQARADFQAQLEDRLVAAWHQNTHFREDTTMNVTALPNARKTPKSERRSLGVMLAALLAIVIFGGLAVIMARLPQGDDEPALGAAPQDATSTAIWATEAIRQLTVEANLALAQPTVMPPTVPPPMATPDAMIQATASPLAPSRLSPVVTVVRPDEQNGVPCQIVDPLGRAAVYAEPHAASAIVGQLPAESRIQVETTAFDGHSGTTWLYVAYHQMGQSVSGWVQEHEIRVLAICFYDSNAYALLDGQVVEPATMIPPMVTPVIDPFRVTATRWTQSQAEMEAAQQLAIEPTATPIPALSAGAPLVPDASPCQIIDSLGIVRVYAGPRDDLDVLSTLPANLVLTVLDRVPGAGGDMADRWLHVRFPSGGGQMIDGWVRENEVQRLSSCFAQGGPTLIASLTVTPTPVPTLTATASATFTPTPIPMVTATFTSTPRPTAALLEAVQVRIGSPHLLDLDALVGQVVDLFINTAPEDETPIMVPVARGVTVQEFIEEPIPNETRYVFIDAVIIPRTPEQAELLAGLSQTHIPMYFATDLYSESPE